MVHVGCDETLSEHFIVFDKCDGSIKLCRSSTPISSICIYFIILDHDSFSNPVVLLFYGVFEDFSFRDMII